MKLLQGLIRLKSGIETNDRNAIEEAFILITGEVAQFPAGCSGSCGAYAEMNKALEEENRDSDEPDVYSIIPIEQRLADLENNGEAFSELLSKPKDISPPIRDLDLDFTMNKSAVKTPNNDESSLEQKKSSASENNFNPSLDIDDEEGYDAINDSVKPVARTRRPHKKSTVFCQDCQSNIEVDPLFKKEPYYCDLVKLGQKCPNNK